MTLENVGTFAGSQTIKFNTNNPDKPITLIGGNNGAGKTTLLEMIQFVLYGARSPAHKKSGKGYRNYLKGLIHRNETEDPTTTRSSVEMIFEVTERNRPTQIIVRREINRETTTKIETLRVTENGRIWDDAKAIWPDWIEKQLPASLSLLFFFDAEQIDKLLGEESSGEFLRQAIHNLLGIDIVDQLCSDLKVLERRKQSSHIPIEKEGKAKELNEEHTDLVKLREEMSQNLGSIQCELDRAIELEKSEKDKFKTIGGEVHQRRTEIERKHADLQTEKLEASTRLRSLAEGPLPLALANDSLKQLVELITLSNEAMEQEIAADSLRTEFSNLISELKASKVSKPAINAIHDFCESRPWSSEQNQQPAPQDAFSSQLELLTNLSAHTIPEEQQELQSVFDSISKIDDASRKIQRERDSIPAEDSIQEQLLRRDIAIKDVAALEERHASAEADYQKLKSKCESAERNLTNFLKESAKIRLEAETDLRVVRFSEKSRETLGIFRSNIIERNLQGIETAIFKRFHSLTHKSKLAENVRIHRETYQVQLLQGQRVVDHNELSAGESQLLATAILWGLADSSAREIPVVVDTPLGRLDGRHRDSLVNSYFPKASSQVVLLSTDEEIVGKRLSQLEDAISVKYLLDFDDDSQATSIREGYFDGVTITA
jgi:DNA sulfur modification protein DndD